MLDGLPVTASRLLEKTNSNRESGLVSHTNSLWGTTSFIERSQRSAENEKNEKWKQTNESFHQVRFFFPFFSLSVNSFC